jgi:hypothetical protein
MSRIAPAFLVVAALASSHVATADSYAGQNGWGLVPGVRIGAVRGTFTGTTALPGTQAAWGHTLELHVDLLKTFGHDQRMYGVSLGYLNQSNNGWFVSSRLGAQTFDHSGLSLTALLGTVLGEHNSLSVRAGLVSGTTATLPGSIGGTLWRLGAELTRVKTVGNFDFATHVALEYFTSSADGRSYHAVAIVLGETFAFGF